MQTFSDNITQKRLSFIRHHPLYVSSLHRLEELEKTMDPAKYVGRAREQVDAYLDKVIRPLLEANKEFLGVKAEIHV